MQTTDSPIQSVLSLLNRVEQRGKGWDAQCPSHDDAKNSLSIGTGDDGRVLIDCKAGCKSADVVKALGLDWRDLFPSMKRNNGKSNRKIVAKYTYRDADGAVAFQVVRYDPKDFKQRRPDGKGGWIWNQKGVRKTLYQLPAILKNPTFPVTVCEGEKDADRLIREFKIVATTCPGGASKWQKSYSRILKGRKVVIIPDNDDAGRQHAQQVAKSLHGVAEWVRIVELPGLPKKGDVSDWIDAGGTRDKLNTLAEAVENWQPPEAKPTPSSTDVTGRLHDVLNDGGASALFADRELLELLAELAVVDPPAYAGCRVLIRNAEVKISDFDRAIKRIIRDTLKERPAEFVRGETGGFFESDDCICRTKLMNDGPITVPLANFTAVIVDETTRDDGVERQVMIGVEGQLAGGRRLPRVEIAAERFEQTVWVVSEWGTDAIVWPNERRALPAAIQALSKEKRRLITYTHTGWRKQNDDWYYLHEAGAIGPSGNVVGVSVDLPPQLVGYSLPDPPSGDQLRTAIEASLRLPELGPSSIMYPLLAAVCRSVITTADFALHLSGPSGVFKSELAALAQQHFGSALDARHLPGSWTSTANSLEGLAFAAKDSLLVVDDFAPGGAAGDVARLHRDADRLLRSQGNHSGRGRMNRDGTLRPVKPPRGLILSTGEDSPRGQSLRARMLILEVTPGDINAGRLTDCQQDAAAGLYAATMAGFVRWLAPQLEAIRDGWRDKVAEIRSQAAGDGRHARTPGIVAELHLAFCFFAKFASESGVGDAERLESDCWQALMEAADRQHDHQQANEPATQFIRLLSAVISSGAGHLAGVDGNSPVDNPSAYGWRWRSSGMTGGGDWEPQGRRVGWIDGDDVLLEPDTAFASVQRLAGEQGETLAVAARTIRKRLAEKGLLASRDTTRDRHTVRRTIDGMSRYVLHLHSHSLSTPEITGQTGQIGQMVPETAEKQGVSFGRSENEAKLPAKKSGQLAGDLAGEKTGRPNGNPVVTDTCGTIGRFGRSETNCREGGEIKHKRDNCVSAQYWQHLNSGLYCSVCWPCTDLSMMVSENKSPTRTERQRG